MKPERKTRRSVSPFGTVPPTDGPFDALRRRLEAAFGNESDPSETNAPLSRSEDVVRLPGLLNRLADAPAGAAGDIAAVSGFLVRNAGAFRERGLFDALHDAMGTLFEMKTDQFLIDRYGKEQCEKMGWPDEERDVVLFAADRDALVGSYFAPVTASAPGLFSEFVSKWIAAESPARRLHFLDFCLGSKSPTFEHYLVFSHPALSRAVSDRELLRSLLDRSAPLLARLPANRWEERVRSAFRL